jgi:hypothetical protein
VRLNAIRVFALALASCAMALGEVWTGWLTDGKCASSGNYAGQQHQQCVSAGAPVVFVNETDKKVYRLENPDKVKDMVGAKVKLSGTINGDLIRADSATKADADGQ